MFIYLCMFYLSIMSIIFFWFCELLKLSVSVKDSDSDSDLGLHDEHILFPNFRYIDL